MLLPPSTTRQAPYSREIEGWPRGSAPPVTRHGPTGPQSASPAYRAAGNLRAPITATPWPAPTRISTTSRRHEFEMFKTHIATSVGSDVTIFSAVSAAADEYAAVSC